MNPAEKAVLDEMDKGLAKSIQKVIAMIGTPDRANELTKNYLCAKAIEAYESYGASNYDAKIIAMLASLGMALVTRMMAEDYMKKEDPERN